jgi:hypothetical protein
MLNGWAPRQTRRIGSGAGRFIGIAAQIILNPRVSASTLSGVRHFIRRLYLADEIPI